MYKKYIWPIIVLLSISLIVTFIVGFGISVSISKENNKASLGVNSEDASVGIEKNKVEELEVVDENNAKNSPKYELLYDGKPNILVIGDSIGFGFGDENNNGIGKRYADLIELDTINSPVYNLSVSGDEVKDLSLIVNNLENESLIKDMDLIIISIGGNDLNRIGYTDSVDLEMNYLDTLNMYKNELGEILTRIQTLNKNAKLAFVGLYDPFANNEQKTKLLLNWNYETSLLLQDYSNIVYIPTYDNFKENLNSYLAFDQFHPGPEGYEYIARELYDVLHSLD